MTDPNQDRWQQLAKEFGLDKEEPARPAAAPPPEQRLPDANSEPPTATEKTREAAAPRFEEHELAHSLPDEGERVEPPAATGSVAEEEKGGRRRGRRGRRRGKPEKESADRGERAPAVASEETADKPGRRPGRRERRQERPEPVEDEAEPEVEDEDDDAEMELPSPVEEDDEELEDTSAYANWTVPSWQELIASLHRPER